MILACIDFSNYGHRLYLMRLMIKTIAEAGHTAICITDGTEEIKNWMEENCKEGSRNVIYYNHVYTAATAIKWNNRLNDILIALQHWKQYNSVLKNIERNNEIKIDAVVINYIDLFLSCLMPQRLQRLVFGYRWAGLYIHTRYLRMFKHLGVQTKKSKISDIDYLLKSNRCIGIGMFDKGTFKALQFRLDKKVILIPDISDVSTDTKYYPLVNEIKHAAAGRIVVGVIGISYYTGILDFIKLTAAAADKNYFFVCCGSFDETSFSSIQQDSDKKLLSNFRKNPPANCLWKEGYLKDEFEYNAVFNTFDIIYQMYPEHYTSSNRLTKAAYFNKFVLAANRHCVGENVTAYHLGEVAAPGDIPQQLEKLNILANKIKEKQYPVSEWMEYLSLNNELLFQKQLKSLLNI